MENRGKKRLTEVTLKFTNGGTPSTDSPEFWSGNIPWVTGSDFLNQEAVIGRRRISENAIKKSATNLIPKGTLIVLTRTGVGKMTITPCDLAISQDITALSLDVSKIEPRFLFHQLSSRKHELRRWSQGTSIKGLERRDLEIFPINTPNLAKQKSIATLFDSIDASIANTRQLITQTLRTRKAFVQRITSDSTYQKTRLGDILVGKPQNGIYCHESCYGNGTPILRIDDFNSGDVLNHEPPKQVDLESNEIERYILQPNDFLVNRVNSLSHLGKMAMIENVGPTTIFESNMMRFKVDQKRLHPSFAITLLSSEFVRGQIKRFAKKAVAQCSIDQTDLRDLIIPLPKLETQVALFSLVDSLNNQLKKFQRQASLLSRTKTALSQKLFT